jgi:hypothetical protein
MDLSFKNKPINEKTDVRHVRLTQPCHEFLYKKMRKHLKENRLNTLSRKEFNGLLKIIGIGDHPSIDKQWSHIMSQWLLIEEFYANQDGA